MLVAYLLRNIQAVFNGEMQFKYDIDLVTKNISCIDRIVPLNIIEVIKFHINNLLRQPNIKE